MRLKFPVFFIVLLMLFGTYPAKGGDFMNKRCLGLVLKDINGKEVKFSRYLNKKMIIIFWSVRCSHCIDEIEELKKIYKEYKDKLNMISLLMIPLDDKVKSVLKVYKIPYPVYQRNRELEDCLWGVGKFPVMYFIDEKGEIKKMTEGYKEEDYIRYLIEKKLNIKCNCEAERSSGNY